MKPAASIIFVCLGNICRSPLAEGIARREVIKRGLDVEVASAGTGDWHVGEPPCEHSIRIANLKGIDISMQRSIQVTLKDLQHFEMVIGLDESNIQNIKKIGEANLHKLGDFGCNGDDVPDPYFFPGFEGFETVYEMINTCVINLFDNMYGPADL